MIKLVIFDLDNTLFDTYGQLGIRVLGSMIAEMKKVGLTPAQEAFIRKHYGYSCFRIIARQVGLTLHQKKIGMAAYKHMALDSITPFDDIAVLGDINKPLALVTSGIKSVQLKKVEKLGIGHYFKEIIIDESSTHENKRRIFSRLQKKHRVKPDEVLVVGDNPESELAAGNALGMITVQIHRKKIISGKALYHIKSLHELKKIIDSL